MPTSTRLLVRLLGLLLLTGLAVGGARAQRPGGPRLWDPAAHNPQYQAQKQQRARQLQALRRPQPLSPVPGRVLTPTARPACFEPFDTTATGWQQLARNDDSSFGPISLGWDFSLFGTNYREVYVNNNGNITFDDPLNSFNAQGFPISTPMIAAFWADVDTRAMGSGTVWYRVYPDRLVVVWNRVGYFDSHADKKNTFQLVIRANTAPGFVGDDVQISYDDMQWTTGDFSGGTNGFDGTPATVGANRGNNVDYIQTGRFNLNSSLAPNGAFAGDPGGIDWLDGLCLGYQVRGNANGNNVPPAVAGLPAGNTITVEQGETRAVTLQFSGPEPNETVTVAANLGTLCNATAPTAGNGSPNPTTTFTITGSACNVGTRTIRFTATDNGLPAPAQNIFDLQVVVNPAVPGGTWTGSVSTAWATAGNWSNNAVPGPTDDVLIPAAAVRMPVLSSSAAANALTVESGASLSLASGGSLRLNGNLTNNGSLSGAGTLLTAGSTTQSFGGSQGLRIGNLTVGAAGLQLSTAVSVERLLALNGNLSSNGNLRLLSTASGTAMVVNNGAAVVTGDATVQRYLDPSLNPGPGYRHLAAPVSNTTLADLATGSFVPVVNPAYNSAPNPGAVTPFPNVFAYNQSLVAATSAGSGADFDKGWVSPASLAEAMVPGRGYTVNLAAGQTLDFVGPLGNGAVTLTGLDRGSVGAAGWHLVGNPYPAPISWSQAFLSSSGLDNAVHVYKSSGPYTGAYASFVNGVGTNGGSDLIPLGQAFFVRTSAPGTPASLNLSNAVRATTYVDGAVQRPASTETRPLLLLSLSGRGVSDQVAVYFEAGATAGFDPGFDAPKLTAGHGVLLGLTNLPAALAINGLPPLASAPVTVPLTVRVSQAGSYTLRTEELLNLSAGTTVQLLDGQTGTITQLAPHSSYTFTADASLTGPRFSLVFNPTRPTTTAPGQLSEQVLIFPNPAHEQLWLQLPASPQPVTVVLYNALGQQVLHQTLPPPRGTLAQVLRLGPLAGGVYSLRVTLLAGQVTKRLILE
ncbi:T9SS type A sorting domain-containing protein [Hymenobacter gummosus]|uniref:T9SS type A sorting domain-containing protein n=1 Tax=Hymenobacter gummosus TaxID=1776032 RepID=A0A3S0HQA4_9BACT|nr:nidogen-like domain-containing protein [Hymenobacter gummosus]RTQ52158.1 T9SS type A sorting domain-containing protein [Hymenobacter gummosus]